MARAGPRKIRAYSLEFKLTAVRLSQQPGIHHGVRTRTYDRKHSLKVLADYNAIKNAQRAFEEAISRAADTRISTTISHPYGQLAADVYWVSSVALWAYFGLPPKEKSPGKRYWNVFGLGKPTDSVSIMCEINPPIRGIDRRPAGAFAESAGELYVLHRGNFNAFRGRIPRGFTRRQFRGTWLSASDGDRVSELIKVGRLVDSGFLADLGQFVAEAHRLKGLYKGKR